MDRKKSSGSGDRTSGDRTPPNPPIPLQFKHTPPKPSGELDATIKEFLDSCRPRMEKLVKQANDLPSLVPTWKRGLENLAEHISKLRIPLTSSGQPSLLLHDLGEEKDELDSERTQRIPEIFSFAYHSILVNTSGSGKTRLLLEGLCRRWGFYFVANRDSSGIGSTDLSQVMKELDKAQDYEIAKDIGKETDGPEAAFRHMQEAARCCIAQALLARFLLLNLFVEEARKLPGGLQEEEHRRLWVLLQAQPRMFDTTKKAEDIFTRLTRLLQQSDIIDLKARIRTQYYGLSGLKQQIVNPDSQQFKTPPFFCVLDEVQATVNLRLGEFKSDSGPIKRPILREIWLLWTGVLQPEQMRVILSGTGIDIQALESTLSSAACKVHSYRTVHNTGAFEDPKSQATYIKRYIAAPFDNDQQWMDFLDRAWGWTRGRYRFTATLVFFLLLAGYHCPHRTIDEYVEALTGFKPTDGTDWVDKEPQLPGYILGFSKMVGRVIDFEKMSDMQMEILCDAIYDQTLYGRYNLSSFSTREKEDFVEYGVARHKPNETVIDEPLAILAAVHWLNQKSKFSMFNCLRRDIRKHSPRKNGFEAYLAFYMRSVFEKGRKLDAIFTLRDDFAQRNLPWQAENFELVTVVQTADDKNPHISVVEPSCGPSSNVGFLAQSGEEVSDWISTNNDKFTFCFPPSDFGPDLLFFIRSKASNELLLVTIQAKNYESVDKETLINGVRTVTPSWFWKSKNEKYATADAAPFLAKKYDELAKDVQEGLTNIPLGLKVGGADYPILRVFASWPGKAELERTLTKNKKNKVGDPDGHPLATLHLENFRKFSEELDLNWFQVDIQQKSVVNRKRARTPEDEGSQLFQKRKRMQTSFK